jgi:hypothetical protein
LLFAILKEKPLIEQSMDDLAKGRVETMTLEEFNRQLDLQLTATFKRCGKTKAEPNFNGFRKSLRII